MEGHEKRYAGPLVSVVTPVFNGERYLGECIESVLLQEYQNWEYHIMNNCSTDGSLRIARAYEERDPRIRVHDNQGFLPAIQNFNRSLLQISPQSKYCKILHADDRLFPDCISKMVSLAEQDPSVGIVGSYVLEGVRVKCDGLPYPKSVFSGREIARMTLMNRSPAGGGLYVFGSPSSLLIRSALVRTRNPFYREGKYHQIVDEEVCYRLLEDVNYGFVHQVLTYSRLHDNSSTSSFQSLNRLILEEHLLLMEYGPAYLSSKEYEERLRQRLEAYYHFLAASFFNKRGSEFWNYHKGGLESIGQFSWVKLIEVLARESIWRGIYGFLHLSRSSVSRWFHCLLRSERT